jgi:putative tricarboxylic transport membrane protein
MCEQEFRRALTISQGDISVFVTRPISATILAVAVLLLVLPRLATAWSARRATA